MNRQGSQPDSALTPEQLKMVEELSDAENLAIDDALLSNTSSQWRKVARVIGATMNKLTSRVSGIPDTYYSQRIQKLVKDGRLESQGDLSYMKYSEIRQPPNNET